MTDKDTLTISNAELAVINAARSVFDDLERRAGHMTRGAEAFSAASAAAFHALNVANAYHDVEMLKAQLHNTAATAEDAR